MLLQCCLREQTLAWTSFYLYKIAMRMEGINTNINKAVINQGLSMGGKWKQVWRADNENSFHPEDPNALQLCV